jgi:V/A-type H+-transporting ATPase subunit I
MSSIERMDLVNIAGLTKDLDAVLLKLSECGCFHMESATKITGKSGTFNNPSREENPYAGMLKLLNDISAQTGYKFKSAGYNEIKDKSIDRLRNYIKGIREKIEDIKKRQKTAAENLSMHQQTLYQVEHLQGLNIDFQRFFTLQHIKIRFGRLPIDSFNKLPYYDDKVFYFLYFSEDQEYYWGMYFTPVTDSEDIDEIFDSLYFERIRLPDFVRGTSQDALDELSAFVENDKLEIENCKKEIEELMEKESRNLNMIFSRMKSQHDNFDLRNKAAIVNNKFYIVGFVPHNNAEEFEKLFADIESVSIVLSPAEQDDKIAPPIKLKNNKFAEPFSMFVEMYGLPSYNGINPTTFVAISYTLLFGIMFADLGQGLVVALIGFLIWKLKKNNLGAILTRVGISSAFFGLLFGSVFGFEELLDPMYEKLGISFLPFKAMSSTNIVLIGAIAIGILLILVSILLNIIVGFKNKDFERAVFSNNGIFGLIFFGSLLAGIVGIALKKNLFTPVYIICLLVLPLLVMFFREPLGHLFTHKKFHVDSVGDFIASNFFEVFEFLLGYATNTLSFVRIGGFVLSHAGMMSVVLALSESAAAGASPIIIVLGNIFVMGMEGLIVGIQVLRLEFYEIFSRFYDGEGKAFKPVKINYDSNNNE